MGREFVKYLPWFLEDNPGVTCPKGFVLLLCASQVYVYLLELCQLTVSLLINYFTSVIMVNCHFTYLLTHYATSRKVL